MIFGTTAPLPENANLLGLMSQSLGTFAVGQGLPGYFAQQNQERFVDNGDGTVTDRETGLQWEQKVTGSDGPNLADPHDVDNEYTWSEGGDFTAPDGTAFTDFLVKLNGGPSGVGNCVVDGSTQTGASRATATGGCRRSRSCRRSWTRPSRDAAVGLPASIRSSGRRPQS